jgi:hypothetical protein
LKPWRKAIQWQDLKPGFIRKVGKMRYDLVSAQHEAEALGKALCCSHFLQGGLMEKHCDSFFFLPKICSVNLFLETINIKLDEYDEGVCTCLQHYDCVDRLKRAGVKVQADEEDGTAELSNIKG